MHLSAQPLDDSSDNMTPAQRLLPLALALLTIAQQSAQAAGNGSIEPYSALATPVTRTFFGAGDGRMDSRDLKAGLSRKFDGGWSLSGTYSRAYGMAGNGALDRYASAMPRADLRPLQGSRSPGGAVVMTLSRRF